VVFVYCGDDDSKDGSVDRISAGDRNRRQLAPPNANGMRFATAGNFQPAEKHGRHDRFVNASDRATSISRSQAAATSVLAEFQLNSP